MRTRLGSSNGKIGRLQPVPKFHASASLKFPKPFKCPGEPARCTMANKPTVKSIAYRAPSTKKSNWLKHSRYLAKAYPLPNLMRDPPARISTSRLRSWSHDVSTTLDGPCTCLGIVRIHLRELMLMVTKKEACCGGPNPA